MQIILNNSNSFNTVNVDKNSSVLEFKSQIASIVNTEASKFNLMCSGKMLEISKLVSDYITSEFLTVNVVARMVGGKKKKKKQYTTPKKVKTPHEDIKKILKTQFALSKSGELTSLKKDCMKCGPGYFMGISKDLTFCGNCHFKTKVE